MAQFTTIKEVLYTVFITPLTAGNEIEGYNSRQGNLRTTDGSLSSMVTIACLTAITFVVIGIYAKKNDSVEDSHLAIWIMTFTLTAAALVSIILIAVLAFRKREEWFDESFRQQAPSDKFKGKFLWFFSLGIIMKNALELAINIDCLNKENSKGYEIVFLVVHIVSILYFCIQTGFISYFKDYKFKSSVRINYGILIVLLTNLTLWFTSLVGENGVLDESRFNASLNTSGMIIEMTCFNSSSIQNLRTKMLPFLNPCGIEYALLATSFMLSLWPSVKKEDDEMTELEESSRNTFENIEESSDEYTPLVSRGIRRRRRTQQRSGSISTQRRSPVAFFLAILFGLILNLPLIIPSVLLIFEEKEFSVLLIFRQTVVACYKFSMLMMVLILFHHISKYGKCSQIRRKLSSTEYILIFANAGTIAVCTFDFIVSLNCKKDHMIQSVVLVENVTDIILTFLQTTLIMHSNRISIKKTFQSCIAAEYVCLLLSISNIVLWVGESFSNVENRAYTLCNGNKKTNRVMKYVIFPILVFYRFHASIDIYGLFSRMRKE